MKIIYMNNIVLMKYRICSFFFFCLMKIASLQAKHIAIMSLSQWLKNWIIIISFPTLHKLLTQNYL